MKIQSVQSDYSVQITTRINFHEAENYFIPLLHNEVRLFTNPETLPTLRNHCCLAHGRRVSNCFCACGIRFQSPSTAALHLGEILRHSLLRNKNCTINFTKRVILIKRIDLECLMFRTDWNCSVKRIDYSMNITLHQMMYWQHKWSHAF